MTFLSSIGNRLLRHELDAAGVLHRVDELELASPVDTWGTFEFWSGFPRAYGARWD
jgi:hypothetical protein